jgi:hypothetical protein
MKSFLQGKRTLDVAPLRSLQASAAPTCANSPAGAPGGTAASAPQIDIVKQGDKIMRIVVTCSCGERTEIECLYPPGQ